MKKTAFIVWARYHRRSELLAEQLGASIHYVYHERGSRPSPVIVRYLMQARQTWQILHRERPEVIFVQNPPIFAVLVAYVYGKLHEAQYVIDSHTGAFLSSRWRWSVGLHRWLSRRSFMTVVHNESQGKLVKEWKCPYCVIAFTPGDYPIGEPYPLAGIFNVAVVCGFDKDEPLEAIFDAANELRDVCFYFTGDARRLDPNLASRKPGNIHLTGYLPYEQYVGLLRTSNAVMDLVNNPHTLLMGAFEAVSLEVPLILSDWPLLRDYFHQGVVYILNTREGVCSGIGQMQREQGRLKREIVSLHEQLESDWKNRFATLQQLLE